MKKSLFFLCCILLTSIHLQAQEVKEKSQKIFDTFKDRRIINSHSIETLQKRQLDFRIAHRFGDIAGDAGGWATFYGFENAADVLIGLEYGLTDRLTLGMFRTKAAGPLKALIHTQAKYSLVQQR
ncbi:MAG TPA: hypothetical protein ENJ45_05335, partial [Phaeodactylibacter sp.]|nr:hypothetical protein [Phaeodactylibacter sp.]